MMASVSDILGSFALEAELEDGELVDSALVLLKTVDSDGNVGLRIRWPESLGYLERIGMLRAAQQIELDGLND